MRARPKRHARRHRPQKPGDIVRQFRVARERGHLILPQVYESFGERRQIGTVLRALRFHDFAS
jgi:hypothetical protein